MSHLHLVDGIIAPLWWIAGYVATLGIVGIAATRVKKEDLSKKVPFIGVISALMLITMSVPVGFLPFHLNLTVLAGILAGPWLGFIAVFIVNLILAIIGHGGITVVGLNTLIIGTEVLLGYALFKIVKKYMKPVAAVSITVIITLLISTGLMVGVVSAANAGLAYALPHSDHGNIQEHADEYEAVEEDHVDLHHDDEDFEDILSEVRIFALSGWGAIGVILLLGIALEAFITSLIIAFFMKVRPEMIMHTEHGTIQN
ncbi:MAG: energy-coupling factor ABC transporter permease [Clostridia bacterium]